MTTFSTTFQHSIVPVEIRPTQGGGFKAHYPTICIMLLKPEYTYGLGDTEADAIAEKLQKARIAELEAALREIADGHIDSGGNRRNHGEATAIARRALGIV